MKLKLTTLHVVGKNRQKAVRGLDMAANGPASHTCVRDKLTAAFAAMLVSTSQLCHSGLRGIFGFYEALTALAHSDTMPRLISSCHDSFRRAPRDQHTYADKRDVKLDLWASETRIAKAHATN